ncbi:hypothetical protein SAMN05421736_11193 [Evansella caseinilytica]|uniref:Integral membrane protein n=1 Tax=Evansella caseinilytica TaxID=1503961 RepID=A0A1H3SKT4_9BACI|nr:hypothetical protein [Evansella caseinilytica]SDZ38616.1 hypothetical protein SAMN05421736_11193 [Evansella caseinilytica]
MIDLIILYQWELFIVAEILSVVALLLFGAVRYFMGKRRFSLLFLFMFLLLLALEAVMAIFIYNETGEISTFLIVITVFVIYACTFGIGDFKKLDRWMRLKIGKWRGVELLSEKEIYIMNRQKDPRYIAKKYRYSSIAHLLVFATVQAGFWMYGTAGAGEIMAFITDLSWIGTEDIAETPYANETMYRISMTWGIVFIIDFIWSWSYTIFPASEKG